MLKKWRRIISEAGKPKHEFNLETNNSTCENCKHWEEYPKEPYGFRGRCHRFPPFSSHDEISRRVTEYGYFGYQPITNHNDWCGEFRNKNYKNWLWNTLNALGLGIFFYVALRLFLNV